MAFKSDLPARGNVIVQMLHSQDENGPRSPHHRPWGAKQPSMGFASLWRESFCVYERIRKRHHCLPGSRSDS